MDELLAPDYVNHMLPGGREGFKQFAPMLRSAYPDLKMDYKIERIMAEGDYVMMRATMHISNAGKEATGSGLGEYRLKSGKIVEDWPLSGPLMVLLTCLASSEAGGVDETWQSALPAAAAVELVHNFSLVHDDIKDNSPKRRGRDTTWVKWGAPMAINVGDALYVMSNQAIIDLKEHFPAEVVVKASEILHNTCLELTRGQFLDMSFEERTDLTVDDYWRMIAGKTAALLSACCHLGALLGGADGEKQDAYRSFGQYLGLAFQVQDDILGIWGNETLTGKSVASDLVEGKNSLPVLVGLSAGKKFAVRWRQGPVHAFEVEELAKLLALEGGYETAHEASKQLTDLALLNLREAEGRLGRAMAKKLKVYRGPQHPHAAQKPEPLGSGRTSA